MAFDQNAYETLTEIRAKIFNEGLEMQKKLTPTLNINDNVADKFRDLGKVKGVMRAVKMIDEVINTL